MQQPGANQGAGNEQPGSQAERAIDPQKVERYLKSARDEQNIFLAILAGLGASIACAIAWAAFALTTGMMFGIVAILIGIVVGIAVRKAGKGLDTIFGVIGAVFSAIAIFLGDYLMYCWPAVTGQAAASIPFLLAAMVVKADVIAQEMITHYSFIHYILIAIGIYEGYKFSFRVITPEEIEQFAK